MGRFAENKVDSYADDLFTVPASLAGLPAISVPVGNDPDGLPIGKLHQISAWHIWISSSPVGFMQWLIVCSVLCVAGLQIIGKRLAEQQILEVAHALELAQA